QDTSGGGFFDVFLVKFDSTGALQWATFFGGNEHDYGQAVAVDNNANVIVAGSTESSNLPVHNAFQGRMVSGSTHGLLAKFDSSGQRVMATYFIGAAGAPTWFRAVG